MHRTIRYGLIGLALGLVVAVHAAELDTMVVTATRLAEPIETVPASVTVLEAPDLRLLANRNVDDALRTVRGVSVLRSLGMAHALPSQINIRGVPGLYATLVLLDGMPLNEAGSGFLSLNEVPVSAVRRVELVRGPYSALYGSDALGGVIHLLTRLPGEAMGSGVSVRAGNESFLQGSLYGSAGTESRGWTLHLDARTIDNYLARDTIEETVLDPVTQTQITRSRPAENFDYDDRRALFQLWTDLDDTVRHRLHLRYFESDGGYGQTDLAPLVSVPVDDTIENRTLFAGSDLEWVPSDTVQARLRSFVRGQRRTVRGLNLAAMSGAVPIFVPASSETDSLDWKLDATLHSVQAAHTWTVGADVYRNRARFGRARSDRTGTVLPLSTAADESILNGGLYAQDAFSVDERWVTVAGVRVDAHSEFGEAVSPRIGALYRASATTRLRASVGRAFRAPTLTELFQPTIRFGGINFESNPNLDPEYVTSMDVEIVQEMGDALTATAAAFYNDMDDVVVKRVRGTTLTFDNADAAWSRGVELGLDWEGIDGLSLFANGTVQASRDDETGYDLDHIPQTIFNGGARATLAWGACTSSWAVTAHRIGERGYLDFTTGAWNDLDPYWRVDAAVRCMWADRSWVAVTVDNVTDRRYQDWPGVALAPGRLWSIEVGVRF